MDASMATFLPKKDLMSLLRTANGAFSIIIPFKPLIPISIRVLLCFALLCSALLCLVGCCSQERKKGNCTFSCFVLYQIITKATKEKKKLDAFPQTHTQTPDAYIILVTFIIEVYNQCTDPSSQAQTVY